jgi:SAM-dependent methyltransferase
MIERERIHQYWRKPWDGKNAPAGYVAPDAGTRSRFLVDLLSAHAPRDASVLEVGCNAGRNLAYLHAAGYTRLAGCDISGPAIALLRATYPELAAVSVLEGPAEELLATLPSDAYDVIVTMAVLEHVHPDSGSVFADMARVARTIITVEAEAARTWRIFPRNYRMVFERLGFAQVEERSCAHVDGLGPQYTARVLAR